MPKKKFVIVDPLETPLVNQLLNEAIAKDGKAVYNYNGKKDKWKKASCELGRISKKIGQGFLLPPSTSRSNQLGFLNTPHDVNIKKEPYGNKIKYIFSKKLF